MKHKRPWALVLLLFCLLTVQSALAAEETILFVDGQDANTVHLRQQPAGDAPSLGLLYSGTAVVSLGYEEAGWIQVAIGSEVGYMNATYLSPNQPGFQPPLAMISNPDSPSTQLRMGANDQAGYLGQMENGETVTVLGELASGWSYVRWEDRDGFVATQLLTAPVQGSAGPGIPADTRRILENPEIELLARTPQGENIFCLYAPTTRQPLYFVSSDENPFVYWDDVNFDGQDDLVVSTATGASNQYCLFFIGIGNNFGPVDLRGLDEGLCNYQLYPDQQLVVSYANHGSAGAAHEYALLRWDAAMLKVVRRSVAEPWTEHTWQDGMEITITDPEQLRITVTDYTQGVPEGQVLYENVGSHDRIEAILAEEEAALWKGI